MTLVEAPAAAEKMRDRALIARRGRKAVGLGAGASEPEALTVWRRASAHVVRAVRGRIDARTSAMASAGMEAPSQTH